MSPATWTTSPSGQATSTTPPGGALMLLAMLDSAWAPSSAAFWRARSAWASSSLLVGGAAALLAPQVGLEGLVGAEQRGVLVGLEVEDRPLDRRLLQRVGGEGVEGALGRRVDELVDGAGVALVVCGSQAGAG